MRPTPPNPDRIETRAVDAWVRREFGSRYDAALGEPVPAELLALLSANQ